MKLSNETIRKAKPGDILKCDRVPGLQLRVFPKRASYYLYYRTKAGKERRPKLTDHGTMTLAEVRKLAREWLGEVASGGDPSRRFSDAKTAPTLADLVAEYRKDRLPKMKGPTQQDYGRMIDRFILPWYGTVAVADFDYQRARNLHQRVPGKVQPNRALRVLSSLLSYAEVLEWRPIRSNPCSAVKQHRERGRKRYATKDELATIFDFLHGKLASGNDDNKRSAAFILLSIYTGARPGEVAAATEIEFIDLPKRQARIVLTEHKTDGYIAERRLFIPVWLADLIVALPRKKNQQTLLGVKSPKRMWSEAREEAGAPDLRHYDLRHTYASMGLAMNLSLTQIGELLGHTQKQTTSRYAHLMDDAGQQWAEQIWDGLGR